MKLIPDNVAKTLSHQMLVAQKASPRVLFAVGLGGVIGGAILACRATMKLETTLDTFKAEIDSVAKDYENQAKEVATRGFTGELSHKHYRRDVGRVYIHNSVKLVRLYGPAVIIGGIGIAALTTSHVTLTRRNASLTAAYSALSVSYDAYRARIQEELGEDKERELHRESTINALTASSKTGDIQTVAGREFSVYARFFDESSREWRKDPELNKVFIMCQEKYANHLLHARGHVFLNEVYDSLGMDRSQAGQVVGWKLGDGDNYIDFGLFKDGNERFINGWERSVVLDFNVDGVIYDKI
jgi:hypothetical protein